MARITRLNGTPTTIATPIPSKAPRAKATTLAVPSIRLPIGPRQAKGRRKIVVVCTVAQLIASLIGVVTVGLLALSVGHCAEAIALLTSTPWRQAMALAIAVDFGMVLCELGELFGPHMEPIGWKVKATLCQWVVALTIGLSMVLNSVAFWHHNATIGGYVASVFLGCTIPALIYLLGRVAGRLAK